MKRKIIALVLVCTMLASSGYTVMDTDKKTSKDTKASEETELEDLPVAWDLTELYEDEDAFEADMERVLELLPEVEELRGTLDSVDGILNDLENPKIIEINETLRKAKMYSSLLSSLDPTDPYAGRVSSRLDKVLQKVILAFAFEESEIMEMPLEKRQKIFSDEKLEPYAYAMKKYTEPDLVVLSEESSKVETLMSPGQNSSDTYGIFDNVEVPRPSFEYPDGTEAVLTDEAYARVIQSNEYDQDFRRELLGLRNTMRSPYANTYASLLEGEMKKNWGDAQIYGFDSTLEKALHDSDVKPEIYDRIIEFAHDMLPKVSEYFEAKKELLGLDEMYLCDANLPVTDYKPKELTYDEAVNIGRKSIKVWGDEYLNVFDSIITSPHVDVFPADNKTSGAFETLEWNGTKPFVLLNYDGTESYISTIVHEMGHAVYSEFAAEEQNTYNNIPDIFTQEVASTANEIMYHDDMIENAEDDAEKLYWLEKEITLFIATLFRQCMYSEFEDYCYKTIENGGKLDPQEMGKKYLELNRLYYGDSVTIDDDYGIDWARIPHLYYDYYVYQYATSITYAASLCDRVEEEGTDAVDDYIDFLKAGKSADPVTLLSIAGVDPTDDKTYEAAGELIEEMIDEFVDTAKKSTDKKTAKKKKDD